MKKSTWAVTATGAVVAASLLLWAFAPRRPEVEVAAAAVGRFEASIDEDAKTRLRERYTVTAPLAGVVSRMAWKEGDAVAADAPLATITPAVAPMVDERTLREQQAQLSAALAQQERATARLEGSRLGRRQADSDLQRSEALARQGFVSTAKLDSDRRAALMAQSEVEAATAEQRAAGHAVEQARAALSLALLPGDAAGRRFAVRSPVEGRVLRVLQPSEGPVALGTPLLELGDLRRMEIVAELLTTDALAALPGSRVVVERWGGMEPLEGRVRAIEPSGFTKISALGVEEQRVRVLIDVTSPPAQWRSLGDGFRVAVRIVTTSVEDALKVPVSAVFPLPADGEASAGHAVFLLEGGRVRMAAVSVGARNGRDAWIRHGLAAGATVVVYPPAELRDGQAVRVRSMSR